MTEFQYLFVRSVIAELAAEGIHVPAWDSLSWTKDRTLTGRLEMIWLGAKHVIRISVEKETYGNYEVGSVKWKQKVI